VNVAAALLDDAPHARKAEPGALALWFRGEERLEHSQAGRIVHADARVAHDDLDVVTRLYVVIGALLAPRSGGVARRDTQRAAVGNGVARVESRD
jgi:hypothetical protein